MSDKAIWHDLECGAYSADLGLWRELAAHAHPSPVLEIGAGTGRVALDLARHGHRVIALERDGDLAAELRRRAQGLAVEVLEADACAFELPEPVALCVVPMQTVQLLDDRAAFFGCARRALRPGGMLALAILPGELGTFEVELEPDVLERAGVRYLSSPTALRKTPTAVVLERARRITGTREVPPTLDVIELAQVTPGSLADEAASAGFTELGTRTIEPTDAHVGSDVVVLCAATR